MKTIIDWMKALIYATIAVVVIKAFIMDVYTIPSSSMEKTLLPGDLIFVDKVSYGARIPFTNYRLPEIMSIEHQDVVVFNYPMEDEKVYNKSLYIKRCIALPGDTLKIDDRSVFINSKEQKMREEIEFNYNVITLSLIHI